MDFKDKYSYYLNIVEKSLNECIKIADPYYSRLAEAMNYSLLAGGKRLRPILALATAEILGGKVEDVLAYGVSIEMIHTYSLIHDDLPAMDNDDYRRGRPTNHKVFGDAMAILAGDALLNYAYENIVNDILATGNNDKKLKALGIIMKNAGMSGMIGGQVIDMESMGGSADADRLKAMHKMKTGALISAPIEAAAVICGADDFELMQLTNYASNLGLAFQIKDDILDVEGDAGLMGKSTGSDAQCNKATYVSIYGLDESKKMLESVTLQAIEYLSCFGSKAEFLKELAYNMVKRDR